MIDYKPIESDIGFADSEYIELFHRNLCAIVKIRTWNGKTLSIQFCDAVGVCEKSVFQISEIVVASKSAFLDVCINRVYETPPISHPYKSYVFLDLQEEYALEIIASGIKMAFDNK